jgi:hypothetical protein
MGILKRLAVGGIAVLGIGGLAVGSAFAQASYELDAVSATQLVPDTEGEIHGNGFLAGGDVEVSIAPDAAGGGAAAGVLVPRAGEPVKLATLKADADCVVDGTFKVPADLATGDYIVTLSGSACGGAGSKTLRFAVKVVTEVTGDNGPSLALSGSESKKLLAIATGLLVLGGAALAGGQVRRRQSLKLV